MCLLFLFFLFLLREKNALREFFRVQEPGHGHVRDVRQDGLCRQIPPLQTILLDRLFEKVILKKNLKKMQFNIVFIYLLLICYSS